ncbi:hypothetical protein ACF9IK_10375 [Kitasatospora hibisci]|uniref:hypothetical protein n=1 Tax=Kitasatospora hibisci TaxID=3369522 RepID=UPI00375463C3
MHEQPITGSPSQEDVQPESFLSSPSVFRFDNDMIGTAPLPGRISHAAPMMHLRRAQGDGVFDRFAGHIEDLSGKGRDVWTIPTAEAVEHAQA